MSRICYSYIRSWGSVGGEKIVWWIVILLALVVIRKLIIILMNVTIYLDVPRCTMCQHEQYSSIESGISAYYPWHLFKPDNLKHLERLSEG